MLGHVLDGDDDKAMEALRAFLPGEVRDLFAASVKLAELCTAARRLETDAIHWGDGADGDGQTRHSGTWQACTDPKCRMHAV